MLPNYGVLIGSFLRAGEHQGQWLHALLYLDVNGATYECAVDVNEPALGFQYRILDKMDAGLFQIDSALPDGYHELVRNSTSGAMDYARSPIITQPLGCLAAFLAFWQGLFGGSEQVWQQVSGSEAGDALIAMMSDAQKVYVFGAPYKTGLGMHDVHCNQGDPVTSDWGQYNGIWQDGCVFVKRNDGTFSAYLGMFLNQTLSTDDNGNPK